MKRSYGLALLVLLVGTALAACSGSGSPTAPTGCSVATPPPPQLLFPIPGATLVPDNVGVVIYASNGQGYTVTLFNGGKNVATTPTSLPAPLPTPIATPSNPAAVVVAVAVPTLGADTVYDVRYALPAGCNPPVATFGYFQTQ